MNAKASQSSYRDRTEEFLSIAEKQGKSFSSGNNAAPTGSSNNDGSRLEDRRSKVAMQSKFNKKASKMGLEIHQTSQKLAKLAKCKSLIIVEC